MPDQKPLATQTLGSYLEALGSEAPAPGGGAAAALTGAQAAALLAMVLRVGGGEHIKDEQLVGHLDRLRQRFLELADEDALAFTAVIKAYKLPKGTDQEKAARTARIQEALKGAAAVPLETMARLAELFTFADDVVAEAKPTVVSDAGIALELMAAGLKAARYNVDINLKSIRDQHFCDETEERLATLLEGKKAWKKRLKAQVQEVLAR